ncbi:MAG: hypothetical protein IJ489_08140 [Clostridia bacterium]|nr:hypothetical protein [Clostridia bacterium]
MNYSYIIHTPERNITVMENVDPFVKSGDMTVEKDGFTFRVTSEIKNGYTVTEITVSSEDEKEAYLSLYGEGDADLVSFSGLRTHERIFRQSPHDVTRYHFKMQRGAIPMVTAILDDYTALFVSDNPSYFDNATTQHINPEEHYFYLSSGDKGGAPNHPKSDHFDPIFHKIDKDHPHTFRFVAFKSHSKTLKPIRRDVFRMIEKVWGTGSDSHYRAMCFASNYMHIRKNETGRSDKWIVAGIEYANTQYFRDSFYQTMIMDEYMQEQSYRALDYEFTEAENPMVYLIWSYRILKNGKEFNKKRADQAFKTVIECMDKFTADGGYYPNCREDGSFRNWFDICCYELDDIDAYNQGLLVCALEAAKRLGYDIGNRKEKALARYKSLFNGEYIPMSEKKQFLALDVTVGEVLYYMLFDELFIPDEMVEKTYRRICDSEAKTPYGLKIVSAPDGTYLPVEAFGLNGYVHEGFDTIETGRYANGGSYHVYEMLFHIASYLHGIPDAEKNMTERLMIDLNFDGATHEYMHTVLGKGVKANQGWNASIYAIWDELIKRGRATDAFFKAADAKMETIEGDD